MLSVGTDRLHPQTTSFLHIQSEIGLMPSRRELLAAVGAASATLAGCTDLRQTAREVRLGEPERRVDPGWKPSPGEWAGPTYGPSRTGHNPHASPPTDDPDEVWRHEPGDGTDPVRDLVVADGTVFVRSRDALTALAFETGETRWNQPRQRGRLYYVDGRLYDLWSQEMAAMGLDGETIWTLDAEFGPRVPVECDGWLYVGGFSSWARLHADTGDVIEEVDQGSAGLSIGGETVYGGAYYWANYDVSDGSFTQRWERENDDSYQAYGPISVTDDHLIRPEHALAGRAESAGRLGIRTRDGSIHAAETFEHVPRSPAVGDTAAFVGTSPIHHGEIGTDGRLVAIDFDGKRRWEHDHGGGVTSPIYADGTVYAGPRSNDRVPLAAYDADTGDQLWQRNARGTVSLAAVGDTLLVGDSDSVRAFR